MSTTKKRPAKLKTSYPVTPVVPLQLPVAVKKGNGWQLQLLDPNTKGSAGPLTTHPSGLKHREEWMAPNVLYLVYKTVQVPPVAPSRLSPSNLPTSKPYMVYVVDPQGNTRFLYSRTPLEGCVACGMLVVVP